MKFSNKLFISFILLIYFSFVLPQAGKLILPEEIVFVKAADAIISTGLPIYESNVGNVEIALWHPPLYIYILSLSFKLFGMGEWSARLVSILFTLATFFIVYLIAKEVSGKSTVIVLSCLLFLLNPFVVQSSLLLDIDNTVLMFLTSLFMYCYIRFSKKEPQALTGLLTLGAIFGATLWAKFGTSPVLLASIFIYHLARKEYRIALYRSFVIGISGTIMFVATWLVYSWYLELPFQMPFEHNIAYLPGGGIDELFLTTHLWGLKNILFWITPFFAVIAGFAAIERFSKRDFTVIDFLLINGILIFIEYVVIGSAQALDFPKYFAPMMPPLSIVIAEYIGKKNFEIDRKVLVFAGALIFIYYIALLKDPFLSDRVIFTSDSESEIIREIAVTSILYTIPIFIPLMLVKRYDLRSKIVLSALVCLVAFSLYIGAVQSGVDYTTNYLYGQTGWEDTVSYMRTHIKPDDVIITKTAMAYYIGSERWYTLPSNTDEFLNLTAKEHISFIILPKEGYYTTRRFSEVMELVEQKYMLSAQLGDFKIYQPRSKVNNSANT